MTMPVYFEPAQASVSPRPQLPPGNDSDPVDAHKPHDPAPNRFTYPDNFPNAIRLIEEALAGEKEDEMFYKYLMSMAPGKDKEIIDGIRQDEMKHFRLFKQLYRQLTGHRPPTAPEKQFKQPSSYCQGIRNAIMGELKAVTNYRQILFALKDPVHYNILTEIITDELRHATLYNFLYTDNGCSRQYRNQEKIEFE